MRELKIGELSTATATHVATIRYYEHVGLLPPPRRGLGRHRMYSRADIERLGFIRRCRALGFTLDEIRAFARIAKAQKETSDCRAIVVRRLTAVKTRLRELKAVESKLEKLLKQSAPDSRCSAVEVLG
jgi:DNA-binding transcriptional MerR regulator